MGREQSGMGVRSHKERKVYVGAQGRLGRLPESRERREALWSC